MVLLTTPLTSRVAPSGSQYTPDLHIHGQGSKHAPFLEPPLNRACVHVCTLNKLLITASWGTLILLPRTIQNVIIITTHTNMHVCCMSNILKHAETYIHVCTLKIPSQLRVTSCGKFKSRPPSTIVSATHETLCGCRVSLNMQRLGERASER